MLVGAGLVVVLITAGVLAAAAANGGGSQELLPGLPSGSGVVPVLVDGNPTCADLGYGDFELKVEGSYNGRFYFDDQNFVDITSADNKYFDWVSTLGIDAVIAKGASGADVYVYAPEAYADTALHPPVNPSGSPATISHLNFCFDYEVTVTKIAETSFTREYGWTIDKTVEPAEWWLFAGDTGTSEYTISLVKTLVGDRDWAVEGEIEIENLSPHVALITGVTDAISGFGAVTVECGVTFPYALEAWGTLTCTYSTALPNGDPRINTATVTTGYSDDYPVNGGTDTADIVFGEPTTGINGEVSVTDDYGTPLDDTDDLAFGPIDESTDLTYERTFTCDDVDYEDGGAEYDVLNTAAIDGTTESDDALVTVHCHELEVVTTADPGYTRTWEWSIDKVGSITDLELEVGETAVVSYALTLAAIPDDSDIFVTGTITITNHSPERDAEIVSVTDLLPGDISATVVCPDVTAFPYELEPGGELECAYIGTLPARVDGTNTAIATLQNYDFRFDDDPDGPVADPDSTTDFVGTAPYVFGDPTTEIDECITMSDSLAGPLGVVCAGDLDKTFEYPYTVGPYTLEQCGQTYTVENVASFVTVDDDNDTGATDSDAWSVLVDVLCPNEGCTPGYWKVPQHWDSWETTGYSPDQGVSSVFSAAAGYEAGLATMVEALDFSGGTGLEGAARNLLRAAVASLLNAAHPDIYYPRMPADVIAAVNAALSSADRGAMLNLATALDSDNNLGCPLN
jgi:hypothetical protein